MGQAISQFDDQFLSRLAIWELAQANYYTLYNQAEAAGDIGPPEYVDEAADACKQAADIAFETEPTTTQGLIAFCKSCRTCTSKRTRRISSASRRCSARSKRWPARIRPAV